MPGAPNARSDEVLDRAGSEGAGPGSVAARTAPSGIYDWENASQRSVFDPLPSPEALDRTTYSLSRPPVPPAPQVLSNHYPTTTPRAPPASAVPTY